MLGHSQDWQYWTKPVNIAEENKLIEKQGKLFLKIYKYIVWTLIGKQT